MFLNKYFNPEIIRLNKNRKGKGIAPMLAWQPVNNQGDPMNANEVTNESGGPNVAGPSRQRKPGGKGRNQAREQIMQMEIPEKLRKKLLNGVNAESNAESNDEDETTIPNFNQMLTRLNNSGLVSKLSNKTKGEIIQHLEQYYQKNNDNENNRRKFIKGISDIIKNNPLRLKIIPGGPSAGVFTGNVTEIQNYLKNNSRKRSNMNVNN